MTVCNVAPLDRLVEILRKAAEETKAQKDLNASEFGRGMYYGSSEAYKQAAEMLEIVLKENAI